MVLPFKTTSMLQEYFEYQNDMSKKYGDNTVIFMEVGSFYEIYEIELDSFNGGGPLNIGKTKEIGNLLNIQVTKKKKAIPHTIKNPYMVGFPNYAIDKFISKLMEHNYTVVKIDQYDDPNAKDPKDPKLRKIDKIYSPSTYIDDSIQLSNYLVCVCIEKHNTRGNTRDNTFTYGYLSAVDLSTGESRVYTAFDKQGTPGKQGAENDIFRFIHTLNPQEIIFTSDGSDDRESLINRYQLSNKIVHLRDIKKKYKKISLAMLAPEHSSLNGRVFTSQ